MAKQSLIIGKGAEAIIKREQETILKDRIPKSYRLKEIDNSLRKYRTRRESRILEKLERAAFPAPRLIMTDKERMIRMEHIEGEKVRDILESQDYIEICTKLGKLIRCLHDQGIIHGDLTTSNMLINSGNITLIDFGLSFFSEKTEDKAVDLNLVKQALYSSHHCIAEKGFHAILKGYADKIVERRLDSVSLRGKNKSKRNSP